MYKKNIKRKDGSTYTVWAQDIKQPNGKFHTYTAKTKKGLEKKIQGLNSIHNTNYTIYTLCDYYVNNVLCKQIQASTLRTYITALNHIKQCDGHDILIKNINLPVAQRYYDELDLAITTKNIVLKLLNKAFNYATSNDYVTKNYFVGVIKDKQEVSESDTTDVTTYTDAEIKLILDNATNHKLFYTVLAYTGLRRGEALALTWEDIDFENNTITVNKSVALKSGGTYIKGTKTSKGRVVPINPTLKQALVKHMGIHGNLFDNDIPQSYNNDLKSLCKRLGIEYKGLHAFRHTFATNLVRNGVDIVQVAKILGHDDTATTYKYYVASDMEKNKNAVNLLSY